MGTVLKRITAGEFVRQSEGTPVVDVRSPGEFLQGHIPGAVNIPLFTDVQRSVVGAVYTHEGRREATVKAMELIAPDIPEKMRSAFSLTDSGDILLYCWRGGMRSESMAWLLSAAGLSPVVLDGGYKAYRTMALDFLSQQRKYIILGGMTGSGKTKVLDRLSHSGHQVTDLEGLACHRGSAFGSLGMPGQPTTEHFANLLFGELRKKETDRPVWLEDESRNIGTVFMPDPFYARMHEAPVIALMMPPEVRLPRLLEEYATFPAESLVAAVNRISKRLGGDKTHQAVSAINNNDFASAIRIVLEYYDKTYSYGLSKRQEGQVTFVETDTDDVAVNAVKVAVAAKKFL